MVVEHFLKAGEGGIVRVFKNACFWNILKQAVTLLKYCGSVRKAKVALSVGVYFRSRLNGGGKENHVGR